MKRKSEDQQSQMSAVSAIAARRAKAQAQAQKNDVATEQPSEPSPSAQTESPEDDEPPLKKSKRMASGSTSKSKSLRASKSKSPLHTPVTRSASKQKAVEQEARAASTDDEIEDEDSQVTGDSGAESPAGYSAFEYGEESDESEGHKAPEGNYQDFLLSKTKLKKSDIVEVNDQYVCIRLKLRSTLAVLGHYDLNVRRGVISISGAKLQASPKRHRVYAPSTHSLPIIKAVSGIDDTAEVELHSISDDVYNLKRLSPLYERIGNGEQRVAKGPLKDHGPFSFSILHTSSEDPLQRNLRPLHMDKKWSRAIQELSKRNGYLKVLACGPKGSGKSTFNTFLLNHLLTLPPTDSNVNDTRDGVAFLDLDPGQPEFGPMGHAYLAHIRQPVFGPPYSHPTVRSSEGERIVKAHFIGANSPKDDPNYYVAAAKDLMVQYRILSRSHPQCPLIINYPGWIFGLGLEIASELIGSLGLTDVVYMSENGPSEVVEPLTVAAQQAGIAMTVLPSQPTEYVARSSSQLRTMQMMSYFHSASKQGADGLVWSDVPLCQDPPVVVSYAGKDRGILSVVVTGASHPPEFLKDILDGAVVGVVAIDDIDAIPSFAEHQVAFAAAQQTVDDGQDVEMAEDAEEPAAEPASEPAPAPNDDQDDEAVEDTEKPPAESASIPDGQSNPEDAAQASFIKKTEEDLPYIEDNALPEPASSRSLGMAIIRDVNTEKRTIELYTPIPLSAIRETIEQGGKIVLVRGQIDTPYWAFSEEYFHVRALQQDHRREVAARKEAAGGPLSHSEREELAMKSMHLRAHLRLAANVPWMKVQMNSAEDNKGSSRNSNDDEAAVQEADAA